MKPVAFSAPAIDTIPPSHTKASHASLLPVISSHFFAPLSSKIKTPINATTPVCIPCSHLLVAHSASNSTNTPSIIFSLRDHAPIARNCSRALSRAALASCIFGLSSLCKNHGIKSKHASPGTMLPLSQVIQPNSIPSPEAAALTKPLAAIPVRNIAAVMRFTCAPLSIKYSPASFGSPSGLEPSARASEFTIGAITPPPRAVFEGIAGPKTNSANAVA